LNPLAEEILKGTIQEGDNVRIDLGEQGKLVFTPYKVEEVE
jgi:hypothetical protein